VLASTFGVVTRLSIATVGTGSSHTVCQMPEAGV
jgi:hypothetical protein